MQRNITRLDSAGMYSRQRKHPRNNNISTEGNGHNLLDKNAHDDLAIGSLDMKLKITNKAEGQNDMWQVSNFLLNKGTKKSIIEAIKKSVGVADSAMLKGIENSMTKSFEKMRDEAIHVDKPQEQSIDTQGNKVSLLSFHIR